MFDIVKAVSYTHLDVYKRQVYRGKPPEVKHLSRARKRNQKRFRK